MAHWVIGAKILRLFVFSFNLFQAFKLINLIFVADFLSSHRWVFVRGQGEKGLKESENHPLASTLLIYSGDAK